jgi:hypothetical protein
LSIINHFWLLPGPDSGPLACSAGVAQKGYWVVLPLRHALPGCVGYYEMQTLPRYFRDEMLLREDLR